MNCIHEQHYSTKYARCITMLFFLPSPAVNMLLELLELIKLTIVAAYSVLKALSHYQGC